MAAAATPAVSPSVEYDEKSVIPYGVVEPFVTGDFPVPMKIDKLANGEESTKIVYYKNILGLRIKPNSGIPTAEDGTRALCVGSGCDLTFIKPEVARSHVGDAHPSPHTIRRRQLRSALVTRLRDVKARPVGEFRVEMPMRKRGSGEPMYFNRLRGVRFDDGTELITCDDPDNAWCDWATDDEGLAKGHMNKAHKEDRSAKTQPPPARPAATRQTAKAAIAKVAAAATRPTSKPAPPPVATRTSTPDTTTAGPTQPPLVVTPPFTPRPDPDPQAGTGGRMGPAAITGEAPSPHMFANPDVITWGHEDELSALTDTIATLQKSRELLLRQLRKEQVDRDAIRDEIRKELTADFREREESLRRQLLAAQEAIEAARRKAKENEAAAAELSQLKQGLAAAQGVLGGLFAAPRT